MKRWIGCCVFSVLFLIFASAALQAEMVSMGCDVSTAAIAQDSGTLQGLFVVVRAGDTEKKHPPDFVQSVVLTVPGGATFDIQDYWEPRVGGFGRFIPSSAFPGGIPSGKYGVTVTDTLGKKLTASDNLTVKFLFPPVVTEPAQDAVITTGGLLIKWSAVSGARKYRVDLMDLTNNWVVYAPSADGGEQVFTNKTYFRMPKGVLRPNRSYGLVINAWFDWQELEAWSASKFVTFTTGSW